MVNFAKNLSDCLIGGADQLGHWYARAVERRRHERRYQSSGRQTGAPRLGAAGQADALAGIVRPHCRTGEAIVAKHDSAAVQLDAAEYAFSSMLEELRDAMMTLPTNWEPLRVPASPEMSVLPMSAAEPRAA